MAPADVEGVLSLSQIESALLDNSQNYLRKEFFHLESMLVTKIKKIYLK